jgi:hypothetical protein
LNKNSQTWGIPSKEKGGIYANCITNISLQHQHVKLTIKGQIERSIHHHQDVEGSKSEN